MKVNFVSTYPPTNCGIAVYSKNYVEAINRLCDVNVIPVDRPKIDPLYFLKMTLKTRKNADIAHIQFDCGFFGTLELFRLSISGFYAPLFYFFVKALRGPRLVTTIHELPDVKKTYGGRFLYLPMLIYYTIIYRSVIAFSDLVLVHTNGTLETLKQYARIKNARIIPHACFIKPKFLKNDECKVRAGLPGKRIITMFGYVNQYKGHDMAIDAMKGLPDDIVLYIAGDGRTPEDKQYVDKLREKVSREGLDGRVFFHGYVKEDDAPGVMCSSDIILMPYRHVVQSGALYYSLAYMKPVLAADIGGFSEVAREYGCIETFKAGDMEDMNQKILRMLSEKEYVEKLLYKAKKYISDVSMENIALRTCDVYNEILK
jgi:glycosyltransferase involved in cell wall biosynthesis